MAKSPKENANTPAGKGLTVEAQKDLIQEEIQRVTKLAKEKEEISIEEINEMLHPGIVDPEVLDSFMQALEVNGVILTEVSEMKKEEDEDGNLFLSEVDKDSEEEQEEKNRRCEG